MLCYVMLKNNTIVVQFAKRHINQKYFQKIKSSRNKIKDELKNFEHKSYTVWNFSIA